MDLRTGRPALVGAVLVAVLAAVLLSRTDLLPPGPHTDYSEIGEGTDLDIQLQYAWAAADYPVAAIPHWDPHPDFGQPLFANPEAFVGHPGFVLGRGGGPQVGMRLLYGLQIVVLLLGGALLGVRLGVPWWLGMACALPLLSTEEWHQRIGVGHLMIIGLTSWPLAMAGTLGGLEAAERGDRTRTALWGALAGLAIGTAFLGGGHYATSFGAFLVALTGWIWMAGVAPTVGIAAVAGIPFLLPGGREWSTVPLEVAAFAVIAWGLWAGRERLRGGITLLLGLALGLFATAGVRLLPAYAVVRMNWRSRPWRKLESQPLDLAPILERWRELALEELLPVAAPWQWLVLLGGLVALMAARRSRAAAALGGAGLLFVLLAWGAGRTMHPWRVLTLIPGLAAINYPGRLQWILLILPWFGWAAVLARGVAGRGERVLLGASLVATALLVGGVRDRALLQPFPEAVDTGLQRAAAVTGVIDGGSDLLLSGTSHRGLIRPGFATGIGFLPLSTPVHEGVGLGHAEAERRPDQGTPDRLDDAVQIGGSTNRWTATAAPGTQVRFAQRDVRGWRCRGGEQVWYPEDDPKDVRQPHRGNNWLRVRVGETGEAECTFHTPRLWLGGLAQVVALGGLLVLWRRRGSG